MILLLLFILCQNEALAKTNSEVIKALLDPSRYNPTSRPGEDENSGATNVTVNMYIRTITSVDLKNMEMGLQITFRQLWQDPRLQFSPNSSTAFLTLASRDSIWTPDTFFRNELEASRHKVMKENTYVRVFPDGKVLMSTRLTLKLACPMDLQNHPFESNICPIQLASYGGTTKHIVYNWKGVDPIQITKDLHLPAMTLYMFRAGNCNVMTATGTYSCLTVDLGLKHEPSFKVLTVFVPCTMWVLVSLMAPWLKKEQILPKLILTILSLHCLSALARESQAGLPTVAYTKAIDVWTGCCVLTAFWSLLGVMVVNWCLPSPDEEGEEVKGGSCKGLASFHTFRTAPISQKMDIVFRVLNPSAFLLFCIVYIIICCSNELTYPSGGKITKLYG